MSDKLSEAQVFDLVCDYLRTKGLHETERTLREEYTPRHGGNQGSGSRLEDLLEKSYVTMAVSGEHPKKRTRSHLDAILIPSEQAITPAPKMCA
jgi:hypothetical protein